MRTKFALLGAVIALALMPMTAAAQRGSSGQLNIIYWQAPSILNPYLSGGTKDVESSNIVLEPLARYNEVGELVPWLAESIPTVENGGVSQDLTSITWTLQEGLLWSDGTPVTSADVAFTAQYCMDPEGGCAQLRVFNGVQSVDIVDERTVTVRFDAPTPVPYGPFVSMASPIIQQAQFAECTGTRARRWICRNPIPQRCQAFRPRICQTTRHPPPSPRRPGGAAVRHGWGSAASDP